MKHISFTSFALSLIALTLAALASSCSANSGLQASSDPYHVALALSDGGVAAQGTVSAQAISNIGTIYLEQQYAPLTVSGYTTQASGLEVKGSNIYVTYSYRDTTGAVRVGAVQRFAPLICDSILTAYTDYCLSIGANLTFPNADIFAAASDGTNLYAVGSTTDNSAYPYYGRLYKIALDSLTGNPTAISATATLPSYVGTGVALAGSNVLATYGTSTVTAMKGGLATFSQSTLSPVNSQAIYDARWVAVDPSNSAYSYVLTGAQSSSVGGQTLKVNSDGSGTPLATYTNAGNQIAESRSTVIVGNSLIISSAGDGGFYVMCKATGTVLASKAAPVLANIPTANSVTNGMAAIPGYLFVANGEAGVYVYTMNKTNALQSNYCNSGVTLTLQGRLTLSSDSTGSTYINAELSANSIKSLTILNALNVVTSRLLVIASGNKGVSLLNVTNLSLPGTAIDDGF